jgi:hypothetical protein
VQCMLGDSRFPQASQIASHCCSFMLLLLKQCACVAMLQATGSQLR